MSEEEIIGILRMIQEQLGRMEARQIEVKKDSRPELESKAIESEPVTGSFAVGPASLSQFTVRRPPEGV